MTVIPAELQLPSVELRSVHKRFADAAPVLAGVDLRIPRGAFVSFLGPSGCGKSTLLRLIAGLLQPTAGSVLVEGKPAASARGGRFIVFQEATLLPWLPLRRNVELPLRLRGLRAEERRQRAAGMLELVGLTEAAGKFPWQLSGGMRMRASIARALTLRPRVLLLDEPFGALDAITRNQMNEELLRIRDRDPFTACFVTHSVTEAVFLSSQIVVMGTEPGRVAEIVEVPFAFPRRAALRESPGFLDLLARTTHALRRAQEARV